jgi:hypothetical protein
MADDPMRARIFEHPVDLFGRQTGVQRNGDHAQSAAGIHEFDVVRPVRQQQSEAVSHSKTVAGKRTCNTFNARVEFAKS